MSRPSAVLLSTSLFSSAFAPFPCASAHLQQFATMRAFSPPCFCYVIRPLERYFSSPFDHVVLYLTMFASPLVCIIPLNSFDLPQSVSIVFSLFSRYIVISSCSKMLLDTFALRYPLGCLPHKGAHTSTLYRHFQSHLKS